MMDSNSKNSFLRYYKMYVILILFEEFIIKFVITNCSIQEIVHQL